MGRAIDELPPSGCQMISCFLKQSLGRFTAIRIHDHSANFVRNIDGSQPLDITKRSGRRPKPFHDGERILDPFGETQLVRRPGKPSRGGPKQPSDTLGFGIGLCSKFSGLRKVR